MQPARTLLGDIPIGGWVDRLLPQALRPYARLMRLDRPIGTWLLLFPCWWSIALAAPRWPDLRLMALFAIGAIVMRGAGCTYNDIVDRDFDAQVTRTRGRPIPSGQVTVRQAAIFLAAQLVVGLAILLALNPAAILVGAASLLLVFSYPFMKRFTFWPQAWLGLAFNWGALFGWAAATGSLALAPVVLYVAGIVWTLGYDTIYALQDKEDDAIVGVRSTARLFGASTPIWLIGFYAASLATIAVAAYAAGLGWPFYALLPAAGAQAVWQLATLKMDAPEDCLTKFQSNRWFGWLVLAAIVAGKQI
jgi:4-hydroxybenzoate polyprenyltransferase